MAHVALTPQQTAFLTAVGKERTLAQAFYWTGGTVLATEYLHHRISDDIDLFTEATEVPVPAITVFLRRVKPVLGYQTFDLQTSFNRNLIFLQYPDKTILKTEFTSFPFPRIERGPERLGMVLDSARDIAVNKLFTISQQPRGRDYVDLYFLFQAQEYDLHELMAQARAKFDWHVDPIQLGSRFVTPDLTDWPSLVRPVTIEQVQEFFKNKAKELESDVFGNTES